MPEFIEQSIVRLEGRGLLRQEESRLLQQLPMRPHVVVGWLAAFFESALSNKSTLACSAAPTNCERCGNPTD